MKHLFLIACAVLFGASHVFAQAAADAKPAGPQGGNSADLGLGGLPGNINIVALSTQFDPQTGIATGIGEVDIVYRDVHITAGRADYNTNTGDVIATDNVVIVKQGQIFRGEKVIYNIKSDELHATQLKGGLGAVLYDTKDLKTKSGEIQTIKGQKTYFTTHDYETPNYHIVSKDITIYPDDRIILHDATFYVGDFPVFYLPYFVQPLDQQLGYFFRPGYYTGWGAFLLNQYGVLYGDHTLAKYMLDLRSERGVAGGVDFKSLRYKNNDNLGHLLIYYAYDTNPDTGVGGENRTGVPQSRYRISFNHRVYLPGPAESTWYIDFDINKLSDEFLLEDYYMNEFRSYPNPDNTIKVVHTDDRYVATLWTRFQLNNFFHTDTRLPELAADFTRQRIGSSNFYYEGSTSIGYYKDNPSTDEISTIQSNVATQKANLAAFGVTATTTPVTPTGTTATTTVVPSAGVPRLAGTVFTNNNVDILKPTTASLLSTKDAISQDIADLEAEANGSKFFRAYTYHQVEYPMSFGENNWFNVVPRMGAGLAYYSDVSGTDSNGDITTVNNATRPMFHAGLDLSGKFSKLYTGVENEALGLDELRHIVEPYIDYSYLNIKDVPTLPTIDRLAATTRPRPIDLGEYTAIDDLQSWNIARIGLRNLLQTRRDVPTVDANGNTTTSADPNAVNPNGNTYNWMGLNTYIDVFMQDPEHDRKLSNLYNDFFWAPIPTVRLEIESQIPLTNSDFNFTEVNTNVTWMPYNFFRITLGHQYLTHNPDFQDSSLFTSKIYFRFNDQWGFEMNHIYEEKAHLLEYQSYSIHRDLVSWTAGLGALIRENQGSPNEYGIILTLTLKSFPEVALPLDLDPNPTGRGGTGL